MEFLCSLGEAEGLGITREEFLYIWNKEMDVKILRQQVGNLFSLSQTQASGNQVNNSQGDELNLSKSLAQQANEIEELKSSLELVKSELCCLKTDLLNQNQQFLEATSASFKDQQEHRLQTVMSSMVDMQSELDTLRSDMAIELQGLSLKLDPIVNMQELIEAALKAFSENHVKSSSTKVKTRLNEMNKRDEDQGNTSHYSVVKNTTNDNQNCINREHADQISVSRNKTIDDVKPHNIKGDFKSINLNLINGLADNHQIKTEKLVAQSSVPPSDSALLAINSQNVAANSSPTMSSRSKEKLGEISVVQPSDFTVVMMDSQNATTNTSLTVHPALNFTPCFFSRIVRSNTKLANGPITTLRVSDKAQAKDAGGRSDQTDSGEFQILPQPRIQLIPASGAVFNIPSTHLFYEYKGDFYTELYYTLGLPCKTRLRLRLAKHGCLAVTAFLSLKDSETSFKQPLYINGAGYISAKSSGGSGYSKLWEFPNRQIILTHAGDEVSVEALVFLQTNRNIYRKITYKQLVEMGYDLDRNLSFKWHLKCS